MSQLPHTTPVLAARAILAAATCLATTALVHAQDPPARQFRDGGSFEGTLAYDRQVGYDYGQYDDNGRPDWQYKHNRFPGPRIPGKDTDPGDIDYFGPYYQGILYNDRSLGVYNGLQSLGAQHGRVGRWEYWRRERFIPLRYDDFGEYQRFNYELGAAPYGAARD